LTATLAEALQNSDHLATVWLDALHKASKVLAHTPAQTQIVAELNVMHAIKQGNNNEATESLDRLVVGEATSGASAQSLTRFDFVLYAAAACQRLQSQQQEKLLALAANHCFGKSSLQAWEAFFASSPLICDDSLRSCITQWIESGPDQNQLVVILMACCKVAKRWLKTTPWLTKSTPIAFLLQTPWLWKAIEHLRSLMLSKQPNAPNQGHSESDETLLDITFARVFEVGIAVLSNVQSSILNTSCSDPSNQEHSTESAVLAFKEAARSLLRSRLGPVVEAELRLRIQLLHLYHHSVLGNATIGKLEQLTDILKRLGLRDLVNETIFFQQSFEFRNDDQCFVLSSEIEIRDSKLRHRLPQVSVSEMTSALVVHFMSACLGGQFEAVLSALRSSVVQICTQAARQFVAWLTSSNCITPCVIKDEALEWYCNAQTDPADVGDTIHLVAAMINKIRERTIRQKWCAKVLHLVNQGRSPADTSMLQLTNTANHTTVFHDNQRSLFSIATTAFNDGVGYSREMLLVQAEKSISTAVSLMSAFPPSPLKSSISRGYEHILRMIQNCSSTEARK